MSIPLLPQATAVWLVDNTTLTFEQIAKFCGLHMLEVKGIADGDVAQTIKGVDPITAKQLTREEITRCEADGQADLQLVEVAPATSAPAEATKKQARYTPLSKRQERPDAISWLIRNHPELNDAQIGRLVGTTKPTIVSIRDRSHWNISNLKPLDPVTLGFCSQGALDEEVRKAAKRVARQEKAQAKANPAPAATTDTPAESE